MEINMGVPNYIDDDMASNQTDFEFKTKMMYYFILTT